MQVSSTTAWLTAPPPHACSPHAATATTSTPGSAVYLERGACLESIYDSVFSGNIGLQGGAVSAQGRLVLIAAGSVHLVPAAACDKALHVITRHCASTARTVAIWCTPRWRLSTHGVCRAVHHSSHPPSS